MSPFGQDRVSYDLLEAQAMGQAARFAEAAKKIVALR